MYIIALNTAFVLAYLVLYFVFPYFFAGRIVKLGKRSLASIAIILAVNLAALFASDLVADAELSNRLLHIFGGGVAAFVLCFLVVRDTHLDIGRFRFFVFGFLTVLALGVANELLEFGLQSLTTMSFAGTVTDTWLDLASNVIGALVGGTVLTVFVNPEGARARR